MSLSAPPCSALEFPLTVGGRQGLGVIGGLSVNTVVPMCIYRTTHLFFSEIKNRHVVTQALGEREPKTTVISNKF